MRHRRALAVSARLVAPAPPPRAAAAAVAAPPAAANSILSFKPKAEQAALLSADDVVPEPWRVPPPSGRPQAPQWVRAQPAAYSAGAGDGWLACATYVDVNAGVAPCCAGLTLPELRQVRAAVVRGGCWVALRCVAHQSTSIRSVVHAALPPTRPPTQHPPTAHPNPHSQLANTHFADASAALAAAASALCPASAARTLGRLDAQWAPALALVAPGGSSLLVALGSPHLAALLHRAAACARQLCAAGQHGAAAATALAGLQLASHLRFGGGAAAEPYRAAVLQLRQAATAASDAGAAVGEAARLAYLAACARADPQLWMAPYLGHRWADAVDAAITAGWSSGEAAVRAAEAWCALVARGRLHASAPHFQRLAEAALGHADLTARQLERLLAAEAALPPAFTTTMNAWVAHWQRRVQQRRSHAAAAQHQHQQATAAAAARRARATRHVAGAVVELERGAAVHA